MPKPLIIGIDVRDLRIAKTGTRTYLEELCKEFKKMNNDETRFHFLDIAVPVYTGDKKVLRWIEHLKYQIWKQLILPLKAFFRSCDIVFCTDSYVPLINWGYKTIPVFHDAFFLESPEHYGKLWLWLYKNTALPAAAKSPFIITPTYYSKKQINYFTQLPNEKLVVIYEGPKTLNSNTAPGNAGQLLKSFSITTAGYILHVGTMYKRKNLPALVKAFIQLKKTGYDDLKLVLAGGLPANSIDSDYELILSDIKSANLQKQIIITGYLPDDVLSVLYENAFVYVFPSINEGFGIPILEAFKNSLPVLVANNTCLPEIGGDAVLQFDPFDIDDIAVKIKTVLDNNILRKDMINKGQERLKLFSWQNTAIELIEVFKKALEA